MINTVPDILARIVERKRLELTARGGSGSELANRAAAQLFARRDFKAALTSSAGPAIISEIKKASPSKGLLSSRFDPAGTAREYEAGGAAALSVLTDEHFFQGSLADLETARSAVRLPVLRKDFTIDPFHVVEAAAHGADAILLIAAILSERELRDLREQATTYGIASLVEVHSEDELEPALASGAEIVGVNNRDLHTFQVTLETSLRLADRIPDGVVRVSESGIETHEQIAQLQSAGFQAFLVGEHLMRADQPAAALRALRG